LKRRSWAKVN